MVENKGLITLVRQNVFHNFAAWILLFEFGFFPNIDKLAKL